MKLLPKLGRQVYWRLASAAELMYFFHQVAGTLWLPQAARDSVFPVSPKAAFRGVAGLSIKAGLC